VAGVAADIPGVSLVAVADASEETAQIAADLLAVPARGVTALLDDETVDAVIIAVPNFLHAEVCSQALSAGKHVLLEKPMALTTAEAMQMGRLAEQTGRVLMIDHIQRFMEIFTELKSLLDHGDLGTPVAVSVARRDDLHRSPGWLRQRQLVGGVLFQSGYHEFDLVSWLLGSEPIRVSSTSAPVSIADELDHPDMIVTELRYASGAVAQVWNCMSDPLPSYTGVVTGTEGTAEFDLYRAKLTWRRRGGQPQERIWEPADRWAPWAWSSSGGIAAGEIEALRALFIEFAASVEARSAPVVSAADGARATQVAQAAYISIEDDSPVELPLRPADHERRAYLTGGATDAGR
jgi:predicted dehydrogenase